ncbi:MAG TPA: hypothetical protein DCP26_04150 [Brevundimonas sp.]|nr:hypothetical protein [Brevundimonas sp.]
MTGDGTQLPEDDTPDRLVALEREVARLHGCVGVLSESLHITLVALESVMDPDRQDAFMHRALVEGLRPRIERDYSGEELGAAQEMLTWLESYVTADPREPS